MLECHLVGSTRALPAIDARKKRTEDEINLRGELCEGDRYLPSRLLSQSGRLSVGLPGPYARARIYPAHLGRRLCRRLYDQLEIERLSRNSRADLRSAL